MSRCRIIGVAGGTASGKTTLARDLHRVGGSDKVQVIALDSYYRCHKHLPMEQRAAINYDHPDVFEFDLLRRHLDILVSGKSVDVPTYDFATHSRASETMRIEPTDVVIVEGILALHYPQLRQVYSYSVFVDASDELRFARRLKRDVRERGRTEESVHLQWNQTVQPMHVQFCAPTLDLASERVSGEVWDDVVVENLWVSIRSALG
jgi:uridine kinase